MMLSFILLSLSFVLLLLVSCNNQDVKYSDSLVENYEQLVLDSKLENYSSKEEIGVILKIKGIHSDLEKSLKEDKEYNDLKNKEIDYYSLKISLSDDELSELFDKLDKRYNLLLNNVLADELKWLEENGFKNISIISNCLLFSNCKYDDILKLQNRKYNYSVFKAPNNKNEISKEMLYGEYELVGKVFTSPLSSNNESYGLNKNKTILKFNSESLAIIEDDNVSYEFKIDNVSIINPSKDNYFGLSKDFITYQFEDDSKIKSDLDDLFTGNYILFELCNSEKRIKVFYNNNNIFIDLGLYGPKEGIYKFGEKR